MSIQNSQHSFSNLAGKTPCRLVATLQPRLQELLAFLEEFCGTGPDNMTGSPCGFCPEREGCREPCEHLKTGLDSIHKGKLPRETRGGLDFNAIRERRGSPEGQAGNEKARRTDRGAFRDVRTIEPYDALESFKPCWERLSHKQQEVVRLYHGEGKGIKEAAELLGKSPSTISGLLARARDTKEEYNEQMRGRELNLQRKLETKLCEF